MTSSPQELSVEPGPRRETSFEGGQRASLVMLAAGGAARTAWSVLARGGSEGVFSALVDARSGELIMRRNLVRHASGLAVDHYPGAPRGGSPRQRTLSTTGPDPWLTAPFDRLRGDNSWVYSDEKDDRYTSLDATPLPRPSDEIRPKTGQGTAAASFDYPQMRISPTPEFTTKMLCPAHPVFGCSWDNWDTQRRAYSWRFNRAQAATQAFYFVNRFHDHLERVPEISFNDAAGNFEESSAGADSDPVHVQVVDGADTDPSAPGFPDAAHTNNASMVTLPDGVSPILELNLFSNLPTRSGSVRDVNSADDAAIVYHEYTHGLSDRLVCCDPDGLSTLSGQQGNALAEAWSDWYALDLLEQEGMIEDGPGADLRFGVYTGAKLRTQPLDCAPSPVAAECPGAGSAGAGGYTYGDFGRIVGTDPHADGEIFAGALWDLRSILIGKHGRATGIARARAVITGAMVLLAGTSPDFLDVRDAIRQAAVNEGFTDAAAIASVFATRGMGDNAASSGATDTTPTESFANSLAVTPDTDGDGHGNATDNCLTVRNLDQSNADGDASGDACDANDDTDAFPDSSDNCRTAANADQATHDGDGLGDACDPDDDEDTLLDAQDNCRTLFNPTQADGDRDGQGDACDPDVDGDGVSDRGDNCPGVLNPDQRDGDRDGRGDACDPALTVVSPPAGTATPVIAAAPAKASFRGSAKRVRVDRLGRFSYKLRAGARLRGNAAFRSLSPRRTLATR
ncbi:MAG TPA: M36 family metallopeptidase, partial [Thermoleophilaceae bacterium]|nr:M36 family metallopeptidase [Thermoleophilaceae bacterium]